MAIEKYVTESFILASYDSREHDKTYKLFTKEFGLIFAQATSVRKLESKLRAHLQVGRMSRITLVRGKELWRITGAEEFHTLPLIRNDVVKLLERFVRGEGQQKTLFSHMRELVLKEQLEERTGRLLAHYLLLVDLGYADASVIGAGSIEQYVSWSIEDMYTQAILTKDTMRNHVMQVLSQVQL
jgi:recombinational DNA repair protein (RecF pathway)